MKHGRRIDRALAGLVSEEGALRGDLDPDVLGRLLFDVVNSLVEWYHPNGEISADQLAWTVAALAFEGLATT